jgi:hypothetical protein
VGYSRTLTDERVTARYQKEEQLFFRDRLNKVIVVVVAEALDDVAYCQHTQKTCKCRQVANHQSSVLSSNPGDDSVHRSIISSRLFSIFILFFFHFIDCLDQMNLETNEIGPFILLLFLNFHGGKKMLVTCESKFILKKDRQPVGPIFTPLKHVAVRPSLSLSPFQSPGMIYSRHLLLSQLSQ